jgi:hypothetical protein
MAIDVRRRFERKVPFCQNFERPIANPASFATDLGKTMPVNPNPEPTKNRRPARTRIVRAIGDAETRKRAMHRAESTTENKALVS